MAKLIALQAKAISEPGRHGDGDRLYLNVAAAGSKSWVRRIVIEGKRRDIGLGSFPTVSLAQARNLAAANRATVAEGRNPLAEKRETRVAPPGHPGGTARTPQFLPKLGGGLRQNPLGGVQGGPGAQHRQCHASGLHDFRPA